MRQSKEASMARLGELMLMVIIGIVGLLITAAIKIMGILPVVFYLLVGGIGFLLGFALVIFTGKRRKIVPPPNPQPPAFNVLVSKVMEVISKKKKKPTKVCVSRNVDKAIKEVYEYIVRDFILSWYKTLGEDEHVFVDALEEDVWEFVENLQKRLQNIDMVHLLTSDVVYKLSEYFRHLKETSFVDGEEPRPFYLHPCLASDESETELLREAVEVLLVLLLPERLAGCDTARHLLREVFTCAVIRPSIDWICDPHFINQTFLQYLDKRVHLAECHKRKYAYAATYEDFIKMINECESIDELLQIRYHILTEIMHATFIEEMKKSRNPEAEKARKGTSKSDLLRARNLKRYLNQCKVAKNLCEKRVYFLGGPYYQSYFSHVVTDSENKTQQRLWTLDEILADERGRFHFMEFLVKEGMEDLLHFWANVQKIKLSKKSKDQHMMANETYQTFIAAKSIIQVEKGIMADMQQFLLGNKGPEAFYKAQHQVYQQLDDDLYPSFLVSDTYSDLVKCTSTCQDSNVFVSDDVKESYSPEAPSDSLESSTKSIAEQSDVVVSTLQLLEDKLNRKTQALVNLKSSHSADSKIQESLQAEIDKLMMDKREIELYVERTDLWCEHVGKWRTDVCLPQVSETSSTVYFIIVVHPLDPGIPVSGWVVTRKLSDFHSLHKRIKECSKWLKKVSLPSTSKKADKEYLDTAKDSLQKYLTSVLQDDTLRHSEAVYSFLIPPPKLLLQNTEQEGKKSGFSLSSIFKNTPQKQDDQQPDFTDDSDSDRKDSIAEPIYGLISEVFELHGAFKWLRRSMIIFVQATFGGTINKELEKVVSWAVSEPMLLYYIHLFCDSIWPDGELRSTTNETPTEEEISNTREKARQKFLENLPDFLQTLLGKKNSHLGAIKLFDAFQDSRTNKHLFYNIFEIVLLEVCPELKDPKLLAKLEERKSMIRAKEQETNEGSDNDHKEIEKDDITSQMQNDETRLRQRKVADGQEK